MHLVNPPREASFVQSTVAGIKLGALKTHPTNFFTIGFSLNRNLGADCAPITAILDYCHI